MLFIPYCYAGSPRAESAKRKSGDISTQLCQPIQGKADFPRISQMDAEESYPVLIRVIRGKSLNE